jgi:hypothetical protein
VTYINRLLRDNGSALTGYSIHRIGPLLCCPTGNNTHMNYVVKKSQNCLALKQKQQPIQNQFYHLRYIAVQSVESQQTFRLNISPPSSKFKNNPTEKPASSNEAYRKQNSSILLSYFDPDDEAICYSEKSVDYTATL